MDAEKKKFILIGIIVVCLIAAAGIAYFGTVGGSEQTLKGGESMWVKCANCGAEYQMDKKDYYMPGGISSVTGPPCKKCGETALSVAIKCPKCGVVFAASSVAGDVRDRCPECGYSQHEGTTKPVK